MGTAILIDGAFFLKRFRRIEPSNYFNATRAADCAWRWAVAHLKEHTVKHDLYRIFFYDCPPLEKQMRNPINSRSVNFKASDEAIFRRDLHQRLRCKRKVALRLGHLSDMTEWTIKQNVISDLLKGKRQFDTLTADDVIPSVRQKGVDMRIGVDISALVLKRQIDQIVLIAGDADFVPAAKLARREGVDFVLDPMWLPVAEGLHEHIDGKRSTCPKPAHPPKAELQEVVGAEASNQPVIYV
ncbi:NYN domain-containing protein [Xanthomonas euvesicatoria]|uniref:NYN domain-containing protein n=1 Tax=Xanthomonas euvesicatoria TaxID=456327 RepID=UPI001C43BC8A|nr:NYN domain-containing protein [Xanthomonas euvesicatoria]MBV6865904.1 NYN domain-containing protein [Xanthomonas campestris pv. coriandri]MCE4329438.1 NYN domain-containing protein [Xanthomonas campestris pv. coriandri]